MYKDPREFFVQCVFPDYKAYCDIREKQEAGLNDDLRAASTAANSLSHMADHIFHSFKGKTAVFQFSTVGAYHKYLKQNCPDFALLKDCSNAHKHNVLDKKNPKIHTAQDISEMVVITEYTDELGPYHIATKEIQIKLLDGSTRVMHDVLKNVLDMWFVELDRLGVKFPKGKISGTVQQIPKRATATGAAILALKMQRGEDFKLAAQIRRYNPASGNAEPVDLIGYQAEMTIRSKDSPSP